MCSHNSRASRMKTRGAQSSQCSSTSCSKHKLDSLRACRQLDCQQPFTATSVLLVQQRFLLPLLLQELCAGLKLVVLCFTRVHSFLPPRLGTEASQVCNLMLQVLCCLMKTPVLCTAFTDLRLTIKLQSRDPDNTER